MKIGKDTIYGNIGYMIVYKNMNWLITAFDWSDQTYTLVNMIFPEIVENKVSCYNLIGCEIIKDTWRTLISNE